MNLTRRAWRWFAVLLLAAGSWPGAALGSGGTLEVRVDCGTPPKPIRALHGVNNGPLDAGGTIDLTAYHRELSIPHTRLHDAHWPNPDVVDVHVVFPDFDADPSLPESYDFARTDDYLAPIVANKSRVVYRLGESIEHLPRKRFVRPPPDPAKWAAICLGIIRHYNEGWANGFRHDIRYWEIWNEPENRPAMWTGTDEEFFRLYGTAARAIKREFPALKVGGPAIGNVGTMRGDTLEPSPFLTAFLNYCRREAVPLDFFSWHRYAADPAAVVAPARAVRDLLDRAGFTRTESHLNEWNYLPDDDWTPILLSGQGLARERCYARMNGAEGAAFVASALVRLQDEAVDVANFYAGDTNPFGLFSRHGVPHKTFHAFRAFKMLLDTPGRVGVTVRGVASATACAGVSAGGGDGGPDAVTLLVSHFNGTADAIEVTFDRLPWEGATDYEVLLLDAEHDLTPVARGTFAAGAAGLTQPVKAPAVVVVKLSKAR